VDYDTVAEGSGKLIGGSLSAGLIQPAYSTFPQKYGSIPPVISMLFSTYL
jgi:hypothetical protein